MNLDHDRDQERAARSAPADAGMGERQWVCGLIDERIRILRRYRLARHSYVPAIIHELERLRAAIGVERSEQEQLPRGG
jgi:hypothetical protein